MKITAQEEYGLRCMMALAGEEGQRALTIPEIAEREGLSPAYVAKLMRLLRRRGLVASARGRSGGYALARPGVEISVGEALAALGDPLFSSMYCGKFHGDQTSCVHLDGCSIRSIWGHLDNLIVQVLRSTSLTALVGGEPELNQKLRARWSFPLEAPVESAGVAAAPLQRG
jgi:Rrf2 family protein